VHLRFWDSTYLLYSSDMFLSLWVLSRNWRNLSFLLLLHKQIRIKQHNSPLLSLLKRLILCLVKELDFVWYVLTRNYKKDQFLGRLRIDLARVLHRFSQNDTKSFNAFHKSFSVTSFKNFSKGCFLTDSQTYLMFFRDFLIKKINNNQKNKITTVFWKYAFFIYTMK